MNDPVEIWTGKNGDGQGRKEGGKDLVNRFLGPVWHSGLCKWR